MKNENMGFLKWMLDFKTIEKVNNEGFANVSVEELIKMGEDNYKFCEESEINYEENKELFSKELGEESFQRLVEGNKTYKAKIKNSLFFLKQLKPDKILTFRKGC